MGDRTAFCFTGDSELWEGRESPECGVLTALPDTVYSKLITSFSHLKILNIT